MSHVFKAVELDLMPQAYAAAARFWVYPILLIIVDRHLAQPSPALRRAQRQAAAA